ncbi:MAG: hypothetical protein HY371_06355, partial [Devosia nanyangense]|nr:hypothetical protein [Devosia nanyangense]
LVDDEPVGALAIIAYEPRTLSDDEIERLKELATQLVAKVRMDAR